MLSRKRLSVRRILPDRANALRLMRVRLVAHPLSGWSNFSSRGGVLMLTLKLPDGSVKQVPEGTRPRQIAESIGKRLAQAAVAAKVNGVIVDLDRELHDCSGELIFQVLTDRDREALDVLRHSCAHIMARAVMRLFPGVQLAFGPTIENGFYYDIDSPTPIREEDFPRIEEEMRKIVQEAEPFERFERLTVE